MQEHDGLTNDIITKQKVVKDAEAQCSRLQVTDLLLSYCLHAITVLRLKTCSLTNRICSREIAQVARYPLKRTAVSYRKQFCIFEFL
jgi:hypothetical protein